MGYRLSTTGWLTRFLVMSGREASGLVKTARSLAKMGSARVKALGGELSSGAVRQLAVARDRYPDECLRSEDVLVNAGVTLAPRELQHLLSVWGQQVNHADALKDTSERVERRGLFWSQTLGGMFDIAGVADPVSGHVINTALWSLINPSLLVESDTRSMPQRRLDALVDISQYWLDHSDVPGTSGGSKPHVTVTIDYQALISGLDSDGLLPEVDGTPVHPDQVRRICCDAGIVRMVTSGESQVLDVGRRTRTIPPGLRRVLERRDRGCTWSGCHAPLSWCDAHHIVHWADGGETVLENLRLLCRRHHRAIHENDPEPGDRQTVGAVVARSGCDPPEP
ncbi:MAG: DUF222 domain-containing protein [Acidobacteria bacterium]|nr:DUF222 domain-containing protein [Acidobacteriota bacterium]